MTPANSLTQAIILYIRMHKGHANRINNIARQVNDRYVKSTTDSGVPDIIACIAGKYVGIEVKIGKDRQSEAQKHQQALIEKSGGIYLIAKTFDQIRKELDAIIFIKA